MIQLTIEGTPTPWAAHKGFGRRAYNPRHKEKIFVQGQLRQQWKKSPLDKTLRIIFEFYIPVPKSASKKERERMLSQKWHDRKPDTTNLLKFAEDTLKGIVIKDDNKNSRVVGDKQWCEETTGRTVIYFEEIQ
jgi:Holliday junction resolvase RusA-like endonuclease